jgi:4'-phosphopantetheinyl transferase
VRTDFVTADIAERFFSESERKCLRSITAADRHEAFFRCWTRKEAYIKATGDGLSLPLHQFDVSLRAGEPALLLATRPDASEAERWTMYSLHVAPGYAAALVVERIR